MTGVTCLLALGTLLAAEPAATESPAAASNIARAELIEGALLPAFECLDDQRQIWKSSDHVGKRIIVLYVYPGDFTGGCIKQAQAFQAGLAMLADQGVEVVGLSGDSAETHQMFKTTFDLKHTLLADPNGDLARQLGIPVNDRTIKVRTRGTDGKPLMNEKGKSIFVERGATLPRWTLIIGRDGTLLSKRTDVNPATDAEEVLKVIKARPQ